MFKVEHLMKFFTVLFLLFSFHSIASDLKRNGFYYKFEVFKGESIRVDVRDDKLLVQRYFGGHDLLDSWCSKRVSPNTINNIIATLQELDSDSWKSPLIDPDIKGGYVYEISVQHPDYWKFIKAQNMKHDNFKVFQKYISKLLIDNGCST